MDSDKRIYKQLKHSFYLHGEYIHYDEQFEEEDEDIEVDEEEFNQWVEDEKNGINDINLKLESDSYPKLSLIEVLIENIELSFPNLKWEKMQEPSILSKEKAFHFASVYTANGNGLLEFTIETENNIVFRPLRVDVSLTDNPYIVVRNMAKMHHWFLYHLNAFEYLDVEDDSETGKDLISPLTY